MKIEMDNIHIRQATLEDFPAIAHLIIEQSKIPARHCIHSDGGEAYQTVYQEMVQLDQSSEICFVVALQDGQVIGALGSELDESTGRGWLRGPLIVAAADSAWGKIASALLERLLTLLPASIHRLDSFLNIANEQGNRFYLVQGFQRLRLVHVYVASAPDKPLYPQPLCEPLKPEYEQALADLHDAIFPHTYANGQRILAARDENHQIFAYVRGDDLLGYLCAILEEGAEEGFVEYIGVRPEARGQGVGRQLLLAALQWFFKVKKMPQVGLTVNDELANARSLYEGAGFELKYTGVHTKKEW